MVWEKNGDSLIKIIETLQLYLIEPVLVKKEKKSLVEQILY